MVHACWDSANSEGGSSLAREANTGDANVKVASATPFYVGSPITLGTGTGAQSRNVTAVGSAAAPNTSSVLPAAPGDTTLNVASVNGYTVGSPLTLGRRPSPSPPSAPPRAYYELLQEMI